MLCFGMEIGSDPLLMELRASLLVVQIDGLHVSDDLVLVAAIGIDGQGGKHPLAVVEGATENTATVQALLDNLIERGLDPAVPRLFIVDGAKALSKAIQATFGQTVAIQRCQIHKTRNCPSSDDLRLLRRLRNGGSGSSEFEVMRPAADAASVSVGWSGA